MGSIEFYIAVMSVDNGPRRKSPNFTCRCDSGAFTYTGSGGISKLNVSGQGMTVYAEKVSGFLVFSHRSLNRGSFASKSKLTCSRRVKPRYNE